MAVASRWPLAAACLGLGALGANLAVNHLHAQPGTVPVPPPLPAPQLVRDPVSFRDIVKKVVPAVVNIEAKTDRPAARKPAALPPGVPEEYRRFFEPPADKTDPSLGFGSGFIIDPAGVVLTNNHVVEGADSVEVKLQDGRTFTSKDIRRDPKTDLAVIKIQPDQPLPVLELGDSDAMEVGDRVLAVGAPFGLTGSVTHGIVSAKSRQNLKLNQFEDFIQTDAAVNPGNSGGPLVNLDGRAIGIASAIKTRSGGFQGVGLAISSNLSREVVKQLLQDGVVRRGFFGLTVRDLDDATAAKMGVPRGQGVVVSKVLADAAAARAGLKVGDVIASIAGTVVRSPDDLQKAVAKLRPGEKAAVLYTRDRKLVAIEVTAGEQVEEVTAKASPIVGGGGASVAAVGVSVADLTPDAAAKLGLPRTTRGAMITAVTKGGFAADAKVVPGAVVVKVDRTSVATAKEFTDAVAAADPERGALLHILRPTGEVDFVVVRVR